MSGPSLCDSELAPSRQQLALLARLERTRRVKRMLKKGGSMGARWFPAWSVYWAKLRSCLPARHRTLLAFEWFFVMRKKTKDGALERTFCQLSRSLGVTFGVHAAANSLRVAKADAYCFMDPELFSLCLAENPFLFGKKTLVYCENLGERGLRDARRFVYALKQASKVLCAGPDIRDELVSLGLAADKVVAAGTPSDWLGCLSAFRMKRVP